MLWNFTNIIHCTFLNDNNNNNQFNNQIQQNNNSRLNQLYLLIYIDIAYFLYHLIIKHLHTL